MIRNKKYLLFETIFLSIVAITLILFSIYAAVFLEHRYIIIPIISILILGTVIGNRIEILNNKQKMIEFLDERNIKIDYISTKITDYMTTLLLILMYIISAFYFNWYILEILIIFRFLIYNLTKAIISKKI